MINGASSIKLLFHKLFKAYRCSSCMLLIYPSVVDNWDSSNIDSNPNSIEFIFLCSLFHLLKCIYHILWVISYSLSGCSHNSALFMQCLCSVGVWLIVLIDVSMCDTDGEPKWIGPRLTEFNQSILLRDNRQFFIRVALELLLRAPTSHEIPNHNAQKVFKTSKILQAIR